MKAACFCALQVLDYFMKTSGSKSWNFGIYIHEHTVSMKIYLILGILFGLMRINVLKQFINSDSRSSTSVNAWVNMFSGMYRMDYPSTGAQYSRDELMALRSLGNKSAIKSDNSVFTFLKQNGLLQYRYRGKRAGRPRTKNNAGVHWNNLIQIKPDPTFALNEVEDCNGKCKVNQRQIL